jgi:hypothetical protein
MKKMLVILIAVLCFTKLNAQTIGGSLVLGFPQGEFKEKVDNLGYGLQLHGTIFSPSALSPFTVGINLGYMIYGNESSTRPLSETIPDVMVDVSRTNNIANFHLLFQVSPFNTRVRPYIEGLFGGAYLFTTTKVESRNSGQNVFESTNFDSFTWSYGYGGGLLIKVAESLGKVSELFIDLKARFIYGTEAEYLKEGSVRIVSGRAIYDVQKSKTNLMTINLGVVAYF